MAIPNPKEIGLAKLNIVVITKFQNKVTIEPPTNSANTNKRNFLILSIYSSL